METIGLRYFNVFGPRQSPKGAYAAVIPLFLKALKGGQRPIIFGTASKLETSPTYKIPLMQTCLRCWRIGRLLRKIIQCRLWGDIEHKSGIFRNSRILKSKDMIWMKSNQIITHPEVEILGTHWRIYRKSEVVWDILRKSALGGHQSNCGLVYRK